MAVNATRVEEKDHVFLCEKSKGWVFMTSRGTVS
jgi:hypothetical protein